MLAKLIDFLLCRFTSFITGVRPQKNVEQQSADKHRLYFANHNSHGDFILLWVSLPYQVRKNTRPVAGADYWTKGPIRRFLAHNVFNMLLIERGGDNPQAITQQISDALQHHSLIIFPEGTRNTDDNTILLPFKSGIYHLAKSKPNTEFVPIWIDNISRVLPKGKILPIPLLCEVHIGQPLTLQENEDKDSFLTRSREALLALRPSENDRSELRQNEPEVQQNKGGQA